jgi:replication factor A1
LIILGLTPLTPPKTDVGKIGTPVGFDSTNTTPAAPANIQTPVPSSHSAPVQVNQNDMNRNSNYTRQQAIPHARPVQQGICKITDLNPYQNKWTIQARVLSKGDIKTWNNSKGEGKLFSVVFADESGEIRATGFKDTVDMFYNLLEENKVYTISKATIKAANKQYSTINNQYEMTLDTSSEINACNDTGNFPAIKYNAVELSRLFEYENGHSIDVLAVVKDSSDLVELMSKSQKQLKKRDITLVDRSGFAVRCTLWGKQAENFDGSNHPVIGIKGAKIGDYGGRTLSLGFDAVMQLNPDVQEAHTLRGWFDANGMNSDFKTFSSGPETNASSMGSKLKTISQVTDEKLGMGEKPDYFDLCATISHIRQENCWYPACPTEKCNKKVTEMNMEWRCEKCDRSFPAPNYRYILSLSVSDYTGQLWLQAFNDTAEIILKKTANELYQIKVNLSNVGNK